MASADGLQDRRTFAALRNPNFRLYFAGQGISQFGTWMQNVGQAWLVYELTGSATDLGITVGLQSLPLLIVGPYAGVVADRVDRLRLVVLLQGTMGGLALVLAGLTFGDVVAVWHVWVLALLVGVARVFEIPARQAFLFEMVGPRDLRNALGLQGILPNAARALGPAAAGLLIAGAGSGVCFAVNAASFAASAFTLLRLDHSTLVRATPASRQEGQLRAGLAYVRRTPSLGVPLVMVTLIGSVAFQWQVVLPVIAKKTFHGGPSTFGFLFAALGAGAMVGALFVARDGRIGIAPLALYGTALAVAMVFAALASSLTLEFGALALVGLCSASIVASCNATLQLGAEDALRGRVMALYIVASEGLIPIVGPAVGALCQFAGGRAGFLAGAAAAVMAAAIGAVSLRRVKRPQSIAA